jgi:hypothetical protein
MQAIAGALVCLIGAESLGKSREQRRSMHFAIVADLENQAVEAVVGFEEHGFGVPVLRVYCEPAVGEPVYFPPCTADPDLALVLLPERWLTQGALVEATRLYLRCSGEWGPIHGKNVVIHRWSPVAPWNGSAPKAGLRIWLGEDKVVCTPVHPAPAPGVQEYFDVCVRESARSTALSCPLYAWCVSSSTCRQAIFLGHMHKAATEAGEKEVKDG